LLERLDHEDSFSALAREAMHEMPAPSDAGASGVKNSNPAAIFGTVEAVHFQAQLPIPI
jgi:hypothetical protein